MLFSCLFISDVRTCELALCLVWSLGFTGVCTVAARVRAAADELNLMLHSCRTPAKARGPLKNSCQVTGRKSGSHLTTRSKQEKVGVFTTSVFLFKDSLLLMILTMTDLYCFNACIKNQVMLHHIAVF